MSLDIEKFGEMVAKRRGTLGVRAAAKEIGVSPATLSRIENGNVPDLMTFAAICKWLGEEPAKFLGMQTNPSDREFASVHLRKKKTTSLDTATALGAMIIAAQNALRDRENI
ncbi:helix-turn-helix domain-containing protein [Rhizobium lusitanum]|jgi:transcriptional regulator with XRE-family HTH domain|uniref:helix-turn-helix domain-containing protein n=1 Tax=Rhizobium lusitanum TaxID=293958 RepID=UPI00055A6DCB|nr:helix-turn-helix transcriptional regulator [Rhizobium lusitanum]NTJ08705.1 helix-turn-helix transcriptional regulator [Rhizobium lusitanum]